MSAKTQYFKELNVNSNQIPSKRGYHTITTDNKNNLYIFGGCNGSSCLNDLWSLSCMNI